jgi:amino acid transporter
MGWVDYLCYVAEIALKAVAVTEFARQLIPETAPWSTHIAIAVSTVFALLQLRSVALSAKIQEFAATLMALIIIGFTVVLLFGKSVAPDAASVPAAAAGIKAWSLVIVIRRPCRIEACPFLVGPRGPTRSAPTPGGRLSMTAADCRRRLHSAWMTH